MESISTNNLKKSIVKKDFKSNWILFKSSKLNTLCKI